MNLTAIIDEIYDCATKWVSADADHPDTPPADWQRAYLLMQAAPQLLETLSAAYCTCWVHNAGITNDIEALRKIALFHADWWNQLAIPTIKQASEE